MRGSAQIHHKEFGVNTIGTPFINVIVASELTPVLVAPHQEMPTPGFLKKSAKRKGKDGKGRGKKGRGRRPQY